MGPEPDSRIISNDIRNLLKEQGEENKLSTGANWRQAKVMLVNYNRARCDAIIKLDRKKL